VTQKKGDGTDSGSDRAAVFGAVGGILGILLIAGITLGVYMFRKQRGESVKSELSDFATGESREGTGASPGPDSAWAGRDSREGHVSEGLNIDEHSSIE
jgi:hypothetical protein